MYSYFPLHFSFSEISGKLFSFPIFCLWWLFH